MKRFAPFMLLLALCFAVVAPFAAAAAAPTPAPAPAPAPAAAPAKKDSSPAASIATAISTVTGIAISPLLGTGAYGAYKWWAAKDDTARAALPWYAQVKFWLPALLLVGLCALKDSIGAVVPPGLKKPLDVLETIENKFSGLVAAGAVVPFALDTMTKMVFGGAPTAAAPVLAHTGVAAIQFAAFDVTWLLNLLTVPFGVAVFVVVWLASHAINVLILLSPWGAIDAGLKAARTALLGLITLTSTMNPTVSAALSIVVIIISYFLAGWAFRLTIFGTIFSWEFVTRRRTRFTPAAGENKLFAGAHLPGVPVRSFGRLVKRTDDAVEFVYKPWLVFAPRVVVVPGAARTLSVGSGAIFSDIVDAEDRTLFTLPPRYHGHEERVAQVYGFKDVRPIGLSKAWSELREMVGGRAVKA